MINSFKGDYFFLSNFYPCPVYYDGLWYLSSEAAFQAAKCADISQRKQFTALNASLSKALGRQVELRPDWEIVKDKVMEDILRSKFANNTDIRDRLIATYEHDLVEGNDWHDNYWGECSCPDCADKRGKNRLGDLLMKIRAEYFSEAKE